MLESDRWWQGQDRKTHQIVAAHLPMLLHPDPRRVLVVGAGAGQTPSRITLYPIERLDCVDIEPAVFDVIRPHFDSAWMADPRVRLLRADGRNYLTHTAERYDIISLEVGQIFRPGVAGFYTEDFYRQARQRLRPGGVLSQFVPIGFLSPDLFRSVIASFVRVFPNSFLWYNTSELLLVGIATDRPVLDRSRLSLLERDPRIHADLRYGHWGGPEYWLNRPTVFLAGLLTGPRGLAAIADRVPSLRDDRPILEYVTSFIDPNQPYEIGVLQLLSPHLEPVERVVAPALPPDSARAIAAIRERNLGQIVANAILKRIDTVPPGSERALAILDDALSANPDNAKAHRLKGDALAIRGQWSESEVHLARALELRPEDPVAHRSLAAVLERQGRNGEAIRHWQAVLDLGVEDAEIRQRLGGTRGAPGDTAASHP
jgi:spermidine synthase